MTNESMTMPLALSLGAEALRADAIASAPGEMLADADRHAEDLAAAAVLEAEAKRLGSDRVSDLAHRLDCPIGLAESIRYQADAWRDRPAIRRTLDLAERVLRIAATEGEDAADRVAAEVSAALDAIDREAIATRADAERVAAMMAEGDDDPSVEDRVLAGDADRGVVAAVIAGANEGERLRVLAAAAEILADLVRDDVVRLSSRDLSAIREALRLDHATPI